MTALRTVPCVLLAAVALAAAGPAIARGDGDDSPWPRSGSTAVQLRALRTVVADLEAKVDLMRLSAARYAAWESCLRGLPVSESGDPDRRFGYAYDERDGTGLGPMPGLAVDRGRRPGAEDYLFFDFSRAGGCASHAPLPGGTADAASAGPRAALGPTAVTASADATLGSLERRVARLERETIRLEAASERFDAWESCVSWVPITEYGDPDGGFGYVFGGRGGVRHGAGIAVDRSDWDDPDYMLLAFVGGDRPARTCQDEPGEGVD